MEEYDVVVVGGGHNGLMVGAYLARAGLKVGVLEKQEDVGGGAYTAELTLPGFKHDIASSGHIFIQANPVILNDELKLKSKYGLKYIYQEKQVAMLYPDGRALVQYRDVARTCAAIEQFSPKDAEAYYNFYEWAKPLLNMLLAGYYIPPPSFGRLSSLLEENQMGRELLRAMMLSAADIAEEWFESEEVRILATKFPSELMISPFSKGTGVAFFILCPMWHTYGQAIPEGGSAGISWALARCLKDQGGVIRKSTEVKRIKVEAGCAAGVVLSTGEEVLARKAVVSNLNVKQLFLQLVGEEQLSSDFGRKVKRIKNSDYVGFKVDVALNEPPRYKVGGDVNETYWVHIVPSTMEGLYDFFEGIKRQPDTSAPMMVCATMDDPTRAPEGKHTLYLYHQEPFNLKGGMERWDAIKEEMADKMMAELREYTTNMGAENILKRCITSPYDFERRNLAWPHGDFCHIANFLDQLLGSRPIPGWGQYRTPIDRLYMCGPSTHPGMGVIGGGRAAVQIVMEDLGIDFEKVIS